MWGGETADVTYCVTGKRRGISIIGHDSANGHTRQVAAFYKSPDNERVARLTGKTATVSRQCARKHKLERRRSTTCTTKQMPRGTPCMRTSRSLGVKPFGGHLLVVRNCQLYPGRFIIHVPAEWHT